MNENYKKHIRGSLYTALYVLPLNLKGLILIPILTKNLDLKLYGLFVIAQAVISFSAGITNLGLERSISRFLPKMKNTPEGSSFFYALFFTSAAINIVIFGLIFVLSNRIEAMFAIPAVDVIYIVGIMSLYAIFSLTVEYFRAIEKFGLFITIVGLRTYAEIGAIILASVKTGELNFVFLAMLIVNLFFTIATVLSVVLKIGRVKTARFNIIPYVKFSLPLIPGTISDWIINLSDRLLIGLFIGAYAVGIYNPGYALGNLILFIPTIFLTMLPPLIARLYDEGNFTELNNIIYYNIKFFLIVSIPIFFGSLLLSKPILALLANNEIARKGFYITPIIALGAIFLGVARILSQMLTLKLKTQLIAKTWIVTAAINFLLNILLLKLLGISAAAISTLISFMISLYIINRYVKIDFNISFKNLFIHKIVISGAFMSLILFLIYENFSQNILLNIILGIISYFTFIFLFKVFDQREIRFFGLFFGRVIKFAR